MNRITYDDLDFDKVSISPRSILYNLEPIGLGTPYVESLTSYISRLAECHNLKVTTLVSKTFTLLVKNDYLKKAFMRGCLGTNIQYINGNSPISLEFVSVLEELTSRKDLIYLTMNLWSGLFSNYTIGNFRKWCPLCLDELKNKDHEIYEPLIWYIKDIHTCKRHQVRLENKCPNCKKKLQFLHKNSIVGHCQYCLTWLGQVGQKSSNNPVEFENFLLNSFQTLIVNAHKLNAFPTNIKIGYVLKKIMEGNNFSSIIQFADFLDLHPGTVGSWINNRRKPSIESMFKICNKINLSIYELFFTNLTVNVHNTIKKNQSGLLLREVEYELKNAIKNKSYMSLHKLSQEKGFHSDTAKRNFPDLCEEINNAYLKHKIEKQNQKKKEIKQKLTHALEMEPPISFKQFSMDFGISMKLTRKYYPELSKKLVTRYLSYKTELKKNRLESIKNEIREVILDLHTSGLYPGIKIVRENISNSNIFRHTEYLEVWRKELELLGY